MPKMPRFRRNSTPSRTPPPRRSNPALRMEELENRVVPATWDGGGFLATGDTSWDNPLNWQGDVLPTPGEGLTFPDTAPAGSRNMINDLAADFAVGSILIGDNGYTLSGNRITLGGAGGAGFVQMNADSGESATISLPIRLGLPSGGTHVFTQSLGNTLTISGSISSIQTPTPQSPTLQKGGQGTLVLTADNSGFTGPVAIAPGAGSLGNVLRITHQNALGSTGAGTTVQAGATLEVANVGGPIGEPLLLNGLGANNLGALQNVAGNTTWAGTITLDSANDVAIGASEGTLLSITGVISNQGAAGAGGNPVRQSDREHLPLADDH